ncbi:MAG: sialate O-acetylesterase [Pirellulaceae bacterium]|nr:sialate O-acetylesterase [Pirellulaceae bacterium]
MKLPHLYQFVVLIATLAGGSALAEVRVPNVFSDHMVLQQQQPNKVWGRAAAGERVTVSIAEQSHVTTAAADGNWHVVLTSLPAGGPHELTITGTNVIKLSDVLVGEVWICSGQSNMQWNVQLSNDADLERLAAKYPGVRMINFPQIGSQEPIWEHEKSKWQVCSPDTVASFSAVGYFFARQLHQTLDVPIGMINNAWGGSACEAWISRPVLEGAGDYANLLAAWDAEAATASELAKQGDSLSTDDQKKLKTLEGRLRGNHRPANIYNGVLKSHLGYGIRGAIWYQGESNAGRAYQYRDLFPLMISSWRQEWAQGDFPFYWVQLADFQAEVSEPGNSAWAELREAQTMTLDRLPKTGQAVIIDIGEGRDIHPRNKVDVGRRLARLALANDYGVAIAAKSPRYQSMERQGNKIVLTFQDLDHGWRPFDVVQPVGFAIAGEDQKFVWADAKVLPDNRIEVSSPAVANPQSVRYAWADNPKCNMYDGAGLPLTPFRTDDWPGVTAENK